MCSLTMCMNELFFPLLIVAQSANVHLLLAIYLWKWSEYFSGKAPCASHKAGLQDQTVIYIKKKKDNKLLEESIEQEGEIQIVKAHKADN